MIKNLFILLIVVIFILFLFRHELVQQSIQPNEKYKKYNYITLKPNYKVLPSCKKFNDSEIAKLTINKRKMYEFLRERNIPVPNGISLKIKDLQSMLRSPNILRKHVQDKTNNLKYPLIVKPENDTCGNGVITAIPNFDTLFSIVKDYASNTTKKSNLIIEEQLRGIAYRILYVNGKLLDICARESPKIVGDGQSTVVEIVDEYNKDLLNTNIKSVVQYPIRINDPLIKMHGKIRNDILKEGEELEIDNVLSYGNGSKTYAIPLDKMHPDNRKMFDDLLNSSEFDSKCLGIDFISHDISIPYYENGAAVLEFNSNPDRKLHDVLNRKFKEKYMKEYDNLKFN